MKFGPVAFLLAAAFSWAALRTAMLWPDASAQADSPRLAWQPPLPVKTSPRLKPAFVRSARVSPETGPPPFASVAQIVAPMPTASPSVEPITLATRSPPAVASLSPPGPERPYRANAFSLSAWSIMRGDGGAGLAAAGQLGGSQAGVRARYSLSPSLALAARVSGPLRSSLGKEAAIALDWQPVRGLPVTLSIERRIGLDRGGRDAFAVGASGGFQARLPLKLGIDGYGQAGMVGLDRRDLYADGALRVERTIISADRSRIGVGAGIWAGAQPGVSRVDIGPQLVVHLPVASGGLRIGAEWRQRIAGNARPGSGPSVTLGADF